LRDPAIKPSAQSSIVPATNHEQTQHSFNIMGNNQTCPGHRPKRCYLFRCEPCNPERRNLSHFTNHLKRGDSKDILADQPLCILLLLSLLVAFILMLGAWMVRQNMKERPALAHQEEGSVILGRKDGYTEARE